ncbi:hypothetical protein A6J60_011060 [Psychrobacter sp. FDAARGOS_221]|nr:hypothetical protein A6J60_011060 [Psychrobacter sp. FDAARGOS_221]
MSYIIFLIVNLLAVALFITYMTNNFLINTISLAGSFYFSMCATLIASYFVLSKKHDKKIIALIASIILFIFSLLAITKKEVMVNYLGEAFLNISMIIYILSGIIFFYLINLIYSFFLTTNKDHAFVWSTTIVIALVYFICSPTIYFMF